jgi:hypothetical protein
MILMLLIQRSGFNMKSTFLSSFFFLPSPLFSLSSLLSSNFRDPFPFFFSFFFPISFFPSFLLSFFPSFLLSSKFYFCSPPSQFPHFSKLGSTVRDLQNQIEKEIRNKSEGKEIGKDAQIELWMDGFFLLQDLALNLLQENDIIESAFLFLLLSFFLISHFSFLFRFLFLFVPFPFLTF